MTATSAGRHVSSADPQGPRSQGLRVLQVVTSDQRRGAELSALALRDELERRGHVSDVVALARRPEADPGLQLPVLGQRHRLSPAVLRALRRLAADRDVVVAHGSTTLPACAVALRGDGPPFVYANIGDPDFWADTAAKRRRVRWLLGRTAAVAARADASRSALVERFDVPRDKVRVIRNGRDVAAYPEVGADERSAARGRLVGDDGRTVVVCVAALERVKRVDLAVRTIGLLPDSVLVLVGVGPQRTALERLAAAVAPGRVVFVGAVADVRPVLVAADAVLLTSDSEGLPGVLIEAGLCGAPVVSTDVGYVRDVVEDGVTGLLVPPDDPEAAAAALSAVLTDRAEMGMRARQRCLRDFDMRAVASSWEQLLLHVVDR